MVYKLVNLLLEVLVSLFVVDDVAMDVVLDDRQTQEGVVHYRCLHLMQLLRVLLLFVVFGRLVKVLSHDEVEDRVA
jgi:hypothetical protein